MAKKSIQKDLICAAAAAVNLALFLVKLYIAISSNSISIYVDSLNSLADMFICLIAVAGFRLSAASVSEKYPFGLGRAEYIVNFLLSSVILFTGLAFIYSSLQRFMYPTPVWFSVKYALAVASTAAVKLLMAFIFKGLGKRLGSDVLKNIGTDSILDFFISACIVISFTLTQYIGYAVDSLTGIAASLVIIISGFKALRKAADALLGRRDDALCEKALAIIKRQTGIKSVSRLQCHSYADRRVFTAEAEVGENVNVCESVTELNKVFKSELNAEIYINLRGESHE